MARGLLGGLLARNIRPQQVIVTTATEASRQALARDYGVRTGADNIAALQGAQVVVLAVKPQLMAEVAKPLAPALATGRPLVISVAAGLRTRQLQQWVGAGIPVVRAMPNRPALLGVGATGLYAGEDVGVDSRRLATDLMGATGLAVWVDTEDQLDVLTSLSGSGPAYFFRLAELMAEAAIAQGMEPQMAQRLAAQTLAGAGQMVAAESAPDLAAMRAAVTSKGGTTAAALASFDAQGLPAIVSTAMQAAATRSRELARLTTQSPD